MNNIPTCTTFKCPLETKKSASHSEGECLNFSGRQSVNCKTELLDVACERKHCVLVRNTQLVTAPFYAGRYLKEVIFVLLFREKHLCSGQLLSSSPGQDGMGPGHKCREICELHKQILLVCFLVQQKGKRSLVPLCPPPTPFLLMVL